MQDAESIEKDKKGEIDLMEENLEKKKISHNKKVCVYISYLLIK